MKNLLPLLLLFLFSCQNADSTLQKELEDIKTKLATAEKDLATAKNDEATFIHTVFFWMNEGVTDEQKADFAKNGLGELMKINSIYKGYYGPAAMTPREVVDNSYDYALVCHFKDVAAHDSYQDDPVHLKFIEDFKDLWDKVVVYDNLVE